jgi:hypothetical protein
MHTGESDGSISSSDSADYPCFVCGKEVLDDHAGIHCDDYHCGYHTSCINTVNNTYNILSKSNISFIFVDAERLRALTYSMLIDLSIIC